MLFLQQKKENNTKLWGHSSNFFKKEEREREEGEAWNFDF